MSNKCLACFSQYSTEFAIECKCQICLDCFTEWIITNNKDTKYLNEEFYTCPNYNCKKKIDKEWIIENIGSENINKLNEILFQKYLTTTSDVLKCPREGCNYAGIYNKNCNDYECSECDYKWCNKTDYNLLSSIFKKDIIKDFIVNDLSDFYVKMISRPCYHCGKYVSKTSGCDHITCVCKGEFCYMCLGNWYEHKQNQCYSKRDSSLLHFLFLFISFILKIIFSFDIICYSLKYIAWLVGINLLVVFIVALTWLITYIFYRLKRKNFAFLFIAIEIYMIYLYYHYYYDDFIIKLKIICLELIVIIAGIVIGGLLFLIKYFFKR
jgi:hypothetical protein